MFPAIFLDRDGVLIENRSDYVRDWLQVKIFPEAIKALSQTAVKKYKIFIVTNQSAVGRGLMTIETAREINDQLVNFIHDQGGQIDRVYMCPHKPEDNCTCRKPKPGLFYQAAADFSLDLRRSWMIGDAWSDVEAGNRAGVTRTILVRTGRGAEQLLLPKPDGFVDHFIFDNLSQAFEGICSIDNL